MSMLSFPMLRLASSQPRRVMVHVDSAVDLILGVLYLIVRSLSGFPLLLLVPWASVLDFQDMGFFP